MPQKDNIITQNDNSYGHGNLYEIDMSSYSIKGYGEYIYIYIFFKSQGGSFGSDAIIRDNVRESLHENYQLSYLL